MEETGRISDGKRLKTENFSENGRFGSIGKKAGIVDV